MLCSILVSELSFTVTNAAELTGKIIYKTERTVRQWRTDLIQNGGDISLRANGVSTAVVVFYGPTKSSTRKPLSM